MDDLRINCGLTGSKLCDFLGCDGCENCVFSKGLDKHADPVKMADNWEVTLSYLPEDIDEVHDTETCVFCGKKHADGYAVLSLAHPEPEYKKGLILGLGKKVRNPVGSLIDVPIACCKDCKRAMIMKDIIQIGGGVLAVAIAIVVLLIPGVEAALSNINWSLPIVTFGAITIAGIVAAYFIGEKYQKKLDNRIIADALRIPQIVKALQNGWFPIPEVKRGFVKLTFSKNKIRKNFRYFPKEK